MTQQDKKPDVRVVVKQVVYIGNRNPNDHWAASAKRFIKAADLYRPKR